MKKIIKIMSPLVKNFFGRVPKKFRETKFVQRTSKNNGNRFLIALVFGLLENATASLNDLIEFCEKH